ncbi:MAG: alpha/beta hydrolase [Nannocystaceae bacterium]|nr:alpha/beta hydrolase [bacterium]
MRSSRPRALLLLSLLATACGDDVTVASTDQGTGGSSDSTTGAVELTTTSGEESSTSTSSGAADETSSTGDETTGGPDPAQPLDWQTDCLAGSYDLRRIHPDLQCTAIEVPLDWDEPDGETIVVGAVRIPATTQTRVGTFWTLDGGPGGSGLGYPLDEGWREEIRQAGYDIIVTPHRGTFSPYLLCAAVSNTSADCLAQVEEDWGDRLQHFNTVEAARDVGEFIRREQAGEDERVVVYGVSYGTYWAQFYAGEFPTQADAIILDSAVPMNGDLALEEYLVQEQAERLLQECVDDPVCGARVGFESGEAFSAAVVSAIDDGDCGMGDAGLWEESNFRFLFGQLINSDRVRNYVPLLAAMLSRCEPELSATVNTAINGLFGALASKTGPVEQMPIGVPLHSPRRPATDGTPPGFDLLFSGALQSAVIATTMLSEDADPAQAELDAMNHFASLGFGTLMAGIQANWSGLPKVEFDRAFASETPMLVLNATYDLQTVMPWAEIVAEQHGAQLIEFNDGQHGVTLSGTGGKTLQGDPCARALMFEFMDDPGEPVDDSCAQALPAVDVNLERADLVDVSMAAFGTDDPWSLLPAE